MRSGFGIERRDAPAFPHVAMKGAIRGCGLMTDNPETNPHGIGLRLIDGVEAIDHEAPTNFEKTAHNKSVLRQLDLE